MSSRMLSCKGTVAGRAPRTPAQALHWSNHLTALLSQLPNYGWKENTRNYVEPTLTANLSSEHGCSTWAMWFAAPKWQRSFHGIGAGRCSYVPGLLNSWTACLFWAGATEATRVWGGAATKAQDALRLSELAWIVPWKAQQLPASRHWDATPCICIHNNVIIWLCLKLWIYPTDLSIWIRKMK